MLFLCCYCVNFINEQNNKTQALVDDTAKINRIKLGKPFQARLCLNDNNKSMGSFNFCEKSQHCDRLLFAVEMFSR